MFVCHGNICRSPMAEFIAADMIKKRGLDGKIAVASSAVSTEEIWGGVGNPVYPPARRELEKHGLSCKGKRAVQLKKDDYGKFDAFIVMDTQNLRGAMRIFGSDPEGKVCKLLDFCGGGDVADPWYSGDFELTYREIERGCTALIERLSKEV